MENIRLGRSGASDEDVRAAAKAAQCDEFIDRLPQGYDTNIGEKRKVKLSGGERENISEVRAYLDEEGMDVSGVSDEELADELEVFAISDGRYFVVEA